MHKVSIICRLSKFDELKKALNALGVTGMTMTQVMGCGIQKAKVITQGLPASPGAACGQIVFHADDAQAWHADGHKVIMVRIETSPEDLAGMASAEGILTARGGMTSHAAVVARGMGKCCVSGAGEIKVDYKAKTVVMGGKTSSGESSDVSVFHW